MKKRIISALLLSGILIGSGIQTASAAEGTATAQTQLNATVVSGGMSLEVPEIISFGTIQIGTQPSEQSVQFTVTNLTGSSKWTAMIADKSNDNSVVVDWKDEATGQQTPITAGGIVVGKSKTTGVAPETQNGKMTLRFPGEMTVQKINRSLEWTVSPDPS